MVETEPGYDEELQAAYQKYLEGSEMFFENPSEIELLAFELGRLSGTKRIYGVDHQMGYNYQRNLRMYSNLNRIELDEKDRAFILMGASHTAFFRDFISRSPKYEMVNTFAYLK